MPVSRRPRRVAAAALGLTIAVTLGACSSSGGSSSSGGAAVAPAPEQAGAAPPQDAGKGAPAGSAGGNAAGSAAASAAEVAASDKLIRTASIQVQVNDVEARAADVRRIAVASGGAVTAENSSSVPSSAGDGTVVKEGSRSTLTLAVPADQLDRVLDDLGKLGTTVERTSTSRDVTATYVDTQSRVATMKASLDQLRQLLARATAIDQIVSLETELSRRQADLDSMQAQLKALDAKVAQSTVTVQLSTAAQVVVAEDYGTGFLGGLRHGWQAFLETGGALLTVLGAVLPFLLLLGLLGVPVLWWRRRRATPAPSSEPRQAQPTPEPEPELEREPVP